MYPALSIIISGYNVAPYLRKSFWWTFAISVLTWLIIAQKPLFTHYYEVMIPSMALMLALATCQRRLVAVPYLALGLLGIFLSYKYICGTLFHVVHLPTIKTEYLAQHKMPTSVRDILLDDHVKYGQLDQFRELIEDKNSVLVLGNECVIYDKLGVATTAKYFYQSPIARVDPKIFESVKKFIFDKESRFVIVSKGYDEFPADLMTPAHYLLKAESRGFKLFESVAD